MRRISGEPVERFVAALLGFDRGFGNCTTLGFADDTGIVAGVVYHNWEPAAGVIEISAASVRRDWLTRDTLRAIFGYPFGQLACQMVVARISENNTRTRRIWRALGATEHRVPRLRGWNEAEIIATLTVETWSSGKFAGDVHGKVIPAKTA